MARVGPQRNRKKNIYIYIYIYAIISCVLTSFIGGSDAGPPLLAPRSGINFSLNLLTPNVNYSGRTAPLTSKVAFYIFIQQI